MIPISAQQMMEEGSGLILEEHQVGDLFGDSEHWGAIFEDAEAPNYRYMLWRIWNANQPLMVSLMLNPSTADHTKNDPTVLGLIQKAKTLGYGGLLVVNLNAFRATSPEDMKAQADPTGPLNDIAISHALDEPQAMILCAWGNHGTHLKRNEAILCVIKKKGVTPYALRLSKPGQPEHPLYKKSDLMPGVWDIDGKTILQRASPL